MARRIDQIVVHCAATPPDVDVGVEEIREWHLERGFNDVGYHYVIRRDGYVEDGRPVSKAGAHAKGYNHFSIGVCLVGGVAEDGHTAESNFTRAQYGALEVLLDELTWSHKKAEVLGHRDLPGVAKDCPSFNVKEWWYGQSSDSD